MKRLLGLLLVMGMVGCGGGDEAPPAGETALPATPNKPQAKVDELPVQTVDMSKLDEIGGVMYEGDSETPFTGIVVAKYRNGQKWFELTCKDGKREGPATWWHPNGQKRSETPYKDGRSEGLSTSWYVNGQKQSEVTYKNGKEEGLVTKWHENGQKEFEATYKDGKVEGPSIVWHRNGQKRYESTYKDGKKVSEMKEWDEEGNEIKRN